MVPLVFCFHECQVLPQNHPHVLVHLKLVDDQHVHINQVSVFKAHALCQAWVRVRPIEVLVTVESHIREPADALGARTAKNYEVLVSNVHFDLELSLLFFHV